MKAIIEQGARAPHDQVKISRKRQLLWFVALYLGGLITVSLIAMVVKTIMAVAWVH